MDIDRKEWYIDIDGATEGPFSIADLRHDLRITPDTLVWKKGFDKWVPIRSVAELRDVFRDPEEQSPKHPHQEMDEQAAQPQDELVIDMSGEPPDFFWILIILLALAYFLIQLNWI